mgnify:CR=1 FL=1
MIYNFCAFVEAPKRVDMYLSALFEDFSRSYVQKLIDRGQVTLNGETFYKNVKLKNRDEIKIIILLYKGIYKAFYNVIYNLNIIL